MGGLEATRLIRASEQLQEVPIIAMTAHAMTSDREKSLAAGMNDHMVKPIDPEELTTMLTNWINPTRVAAPLLQGISKQLQSDEAIALPVTNRLDIEKGLHHVGDSREMYVRLLGEFTAQNRNTPSRLSEDLANHCENDAELLAHSIKGSAGALGAITLQQLAGSIEQALCHHDMPAVYSLLPAFEHEITGLCDDLQDFLTGTRNRQARSAEQPENRDQASARNLLKNYQPFYYQVILRPRESLSSYDRSWGIWTLIRRWMRWKPMLWM